MRIHQAFVTSLLAVVLLGGCSDDGDGDSQPEPTPTRDENGLSLVSCDEAPEEDAAGPYEADEVAWVQERADFLGEAFEAEEVRYCVDPSGKPNYFVFLEGDLDEAGTEESCATGETALQSEPGAIHLVADGEEHACT